MIIILDRLKEWYDENLLDQQQGFRPGRGTCDGIYLVKRLQQISSIMKKPMYVLFIDLTAAFDHVNRDWLFTSIKKRFPGHTNNLLFELLQSLYSNTKTTLDGDLRLPNKSRTKARCTTSMWTLFFGFLLQNVVKRASNFRN